AIGWFPPGPCDWNNAQLKIGYLTSAVADDEAAGRMLMGLSKHLDAKEVKLHVYSTEAAVRREKQSFGQGPFVAASGKRGKETLDTMQRRKVAFWSAALDHDLATCAKELASQIFRDQIDVLIVDANLADPIAAVVSQWPVARAKLNLVRRTPLLGGGMNGAVYVESALHRADSSAWAKRSVMSHFIQEGVEAPADSAAAPQRSAFGIPDQSIILATVANEADGTMSDDFIDAIVNSLRQHPLSVLLVAGENDGGTLKRRLDAAGLGKRVGFAGKRKDICEFLRMADVYLTPFPRCTATGTLAAMAAGRAVVALAGDAEDPQSPVSILGEEFVSEDTGSYLDRVGRLVRDPALRAKTGEEMKSRAIETFGFEHTAAAIEQICRDLLPAKEAAPASKAA
ncbi:MAG TPA: glycosyltransferase, partial [Tepidisphaeraceae bacterium]